MARPLRVYASGLLHHVFTRGDNKQCVFADDDDHRVFLEWLAIALARFGVEAAGYCLLWNHYHLLLVPHGDTTISRMMQQLNSRYCRRFNRRHGRVGHVLQGRFGCRIVEDGAYARTAIRYLALNPVAAGRASRPEDWPWSSYRVALGLDATPEFLALQYVWSAFDTSDAEIGRARLAEFVRAGLEEAFPNSLLHGSVRLHERVAPVIEPHQTNRDFTYEQRFAARVPLERRPHGLLAARLHAGGAGSRAGPRSIDGVPVDSTREGPSSASGGSVLCGGHRCKKQDLTPGGA
jgi:putative transposase